MKKIHLKPISLLLVITILLTGNMSLQANSYNLTIVGGGLKQKLTFEKYQQWSGEKNHDKLWERAKNLKKGHTPKSLFINNQQQGAGSGWHPNPVEQQNGAKDAYLHLGQLTVTSVKPSTSKNAVLATVPLVNDTSMKVLKRANLKITKQDSSTLTVGKTLGISETLSITAKFPGSSFQGSATLSCNLSKEKRTTKTHGVEGFIQSEVELTPYTKCMISLSADSSVKDINWKAPAYISGWLGIDYGKRVDGHYFWFLKFDSNNKRYVTGTFKDVDVFNYTSNAYDAKHTRLTLKSTKNSVPIATIKKVSKGKIGKKTSKGMTLPKPKNTNGLM